MTDFYGISARKHDECQSSSHGNVEPSGSHYRPMNASVDRAMAKEPYTLCVSGPIQPSMGVCVYTYSVEELPMPTSVGFRRAPPFQVEPCAGRAAPRRCHQFVGAATDF